MPSSFARACPALMLALAALAPAARAGGLDIHAGGDIAAIGLPVYPGAVRQGDKDDAANGFSFGLWGESFGIHLNALAYRSAASVDEVAGFYRDALAGYGTVLDCSARRSERPPEPKRQGKDKPLACDDDHAEAGGRLYKVGTEHDERIVRIRPESAGVSFQLVRIDTRGLD